MEAPTIEFQIAYAAYGKDDVRVLTWAQDAAADVVRDAAAEVVRDLCFGIRVEGDFLASYERGDNAAILPSDTLRRHAVAACDEDPAGSAEALTAAIAARILAANPALRTVTVTAGGRRWQRIGEHSNVLGPGRTKAEAVASRTGPTHIRGGITGLELLTTTGSAFTGFLRDPLTTQAESTDRPLAGTLDANWSYEPDQTAHTEEIVKRLLKAVADRPSNAVQQLLTEVAGAVLAATPGLAEIALHFTSVPVAPIPHELTAETPGHAHELGVGAVGVTDVVVRRA